MARLDRELYKRVRDSGVRKRVARTVAEAAGQADSRTPKALNDAAKSLRSVAAELEDRARGGPAKRKRSAQKAVRTRRAKAAERSRAATKGAKTRAKATGTRTKATTRAKVATTRAKATSPRAKTRAKSTGKRTKSS